MCEVHRLQEILPGHQRGKWLLEGYRFTPEKVCLLCLSWARLRFLLLLLCAIGELALLLQRRLDQAAGSRVHGFSPGLRRANRRLLLSSCDAARRCRRGDAGAGGLGQFLGVLPPRTSGRAMAAAALPGDGRAPG